MPAHDQRREPVEKAAAAVDNPLLREAGDGVDSRAPGADRPCLKREVWGTEPIYDAIFLSAGVLALVQAKKVTLHDLADETADGVMVVDNSAGATLTSSDGGSRDGTALCLGDTAGCRCVSGPLEVRDARGEGLPLLRTLDFRGPGSTLGSCQLCCAGGLAVAVGGDGLARRRDADSMRIYYYCRTSPT
jgi:hypothetical protein